MALPKQSVTRMKAARQHIHDAGNTLTPLGMVALDVSKNALLAEVRQVKSALWVQKWYC